MRRLLGCLVAIVACASTCRAFDLPPLIAESPSAADATLVADGHAATVYVDADDFAVVRNVAELFADDVERVSHARPAVAHRVEDLHDTVVIVGTVGHSAAIDALVVAKKIDVTPLRDQWERFAIQTVDAPFPGVARAIVIVGSDRRGTAYGTLELSEQIGVSPWYWWADVAPQSHASLSVRAGTYLSKPPAVRYRGIFINDEDWGLQPWAAKTFDPAFGNIGPKTYARVFELLLRLKANYLWPAMHNCSTEFGSVPENVRLADEWGIVMGASHCEPINRNNVWWDAKTRGEWRYDTNRDNVIQYWREWAQQRGQYEAVWTLGLRGIHDASIQFPPDLPGKVRVVSQAIADQRDLLKQYVNADVTRVPQVFMPYKEALTQYRAGIEVPDDVTLVWCDDNFGFIRQLSTTKEQQRSGRSGVYYHLSYLGRPKPYLWLNTTSPALIYSEMSKALAFGADRAWVINVGDIKPGEVGMDFWCRMAWDPTRFDAAAQPTFLKDFAAKQFGPEQADAIAGVLRDYYKLAAVRKPELMEPNVFSVVNDDEAVLTLEAARDLRARAEAINNALPAALRDGFYELVLYPVRIQTAIAERFIAGDFNRLAAMQCRDATANGWADHVDAAGKTIDAETTYFNETLVGGKWRNMVTPRGSDRNDGLAWPTPVRPSATTQPTLRVTLDGQASPVGHVDAPHVDIAATSGTLQSPWRVDGAFITVPTTQRQLADADAAPQARFAFDVASPGATNLFVHADCPNDKSDSFFYRVDDGAWQTWANAPVGRAGLAWSRVTAATLEAGPHALTIAMRESGIQLYGFRLTSDDTAPSVDEQFSGANADTLVFDRAAGNDATEMFGVVGDGFSIDRSSPWIVLAARMVDGVTRAEAHVDWSKVTPGPESTGTITVRAGDVARTIGVKAFDHGLGATAEWRDANRAQPFVESNGVVSINAAHFTRAPENGDVAWHSVSGLGRSGAAIAAWPAGGASHADGVAPAEYDVITSTAGEARLDVYVLPTHAVNAEHGARFAASIDDGRPQVVDFNEEGGPAGEMSPRWASNVTRNVSVNAVLLKIASPGRHTIKLWIVDPGVVVDKLVLDLGGARPSECGPAESRQLAPTK